MLTHLVVDPLPHLVAPTIHWFYYLSLPIMWVACAQYKKFDHCSKACTPPTHLVVLPLPHLVGPAPLHLGTEGWGTHNRWYNLRSSRCCCFKIQDSEPKVC